MLRKNKSNRLSLLLCVLLISTTTGCATPQLMKEWANSQYQADPVSPVSPLQLESGEIVETPVCQMDDAITALAIAGDKMGYSNALAELTGLSEQTIDGIDCYRLQQNFGGIPVYGRTFSLLADETGASLLLSGNVLDIDEQEIHNQPVASTEEITAEITAYFQGNQTALCDSPPKLYLYARDDGWQYAYQVFARIENLGFREVLVDAETSEVITVSETAYNMGPGLDALLQPGTVREILQANAKTKRVAGYPVGIREEDGVFYLEDEERNIIIGDWNGQNSESDSSKSERVQSKDGNFDPDAEALLYYLSLAYDYFNLRQHRINAKNRIIQWVPNKNCE